MSTSVGLKTHFQNLSSETNSSSKGEGSEYAIDTLTTNYDLPIEFHKDSVNAWQAKENENRDLSRSFTVYDKMQSFSVVDSVVDSVVLSKRRTQHSNAWALRFTLAEHDNLQKRKSRFEFLDPEILHGALRKRKRFGFVQSVAINQLSKDVTNIFNVIKSCGVCEQLKKADIMDVPDRLFSWSLSEFIKRRKQKTLWIDMLLKQYSEECLEVLKFKFDLDEILRFYDLIFTAENEGVDFYANVILPTVEDAIALLKIEDTLTNEFATNSALVRQYLNDSLSLSLNKGKDSELRAKFDFIAEQIMNCDVYDPIEVRHQLGHHRSQVAQADIYFEAQTNLIRDEIRHYKILIQTEAYCAQCTLNSMYSEIEKFKNRIEQLTIQYNTDLEEMENSISYKKLSLEKLKSQHKFLLEQVEQFHDDIEKMRLRVIAEREKQAQIALERIQMEAIKTAQAALKKSNKKKKKKGKK